MTVAVFKGTANRSYTCLSGTTYTADANGYIQNVAAQDTLDLINMACTFIAAGNSSNRVSLVSMKNIDGTTLAASASSGKFGISITLGTSEVLIAEAAQNNTKTDSAIAEIVLPASYVGGSDITLTVNANFSGSGTAGTKTIDALAYKGADDGTQGSDLVSTSAQTLTTSAADYAFTIDGETLSPGDRIVVKITTALQETGNLSTITAQVNSLRFA